MTAPPHILLRLSEIGVDASIPAWQARHVRFCNLASAFAGIFTLIFLGLELTLILDWGVWETKPVIIAVLRALAVLPFGVPLLLNQRRRHDAARLVMLAWSLIFVVGLALLYAHQAPTQLFLLPLIVATMAVFPWKQPRRMWAMIALCFVGLGAVLAIRAWHTPLVPVQREIVLLLMDESLTVGGALLTLIISLVLRTTTERAERAALREQERADRLLLNILPASIAERLKDHHNTIADGIRDATVLFADIVGFTPLSEKLTPDEMLRLMDDVFSRFDALVDRFGLEKIKTIGDAYMLAGGLPEPSIDHAAAVADMALAMQAEIRQIHTPDGVPLRLRIGISTGPVVAGVIGRKKFLYDLWGDTVNTASRMESTSEPGRIQVSQTTWKQLETRYRFSTSRLIEIKGKGTMNTWFLEDRIA